MTTLALNCIYISTGEKTQLEAEIIENGLNDFFVSKNLVFKKIFRSWKLKVPTHLAPLKAKESLRMHKNPDGAWNIVARHNYVGYLTKPVNFKAI